jgi:predicted transcriptional regulator
MSELDDELKEVKIHQIMTKDMIAASPSNKFSQAFQFFSERNLNHLPTQRTRSLFVNRQVFSQK